MGSVETDVVVAGGGIGGCALGALLGRQGAHVAILERSPSPDHYKKVCSHYIQASGTPVLRRLGLAEAIEAAGGIRNGVEIHTDAGWYAPEDVDHGYSIRRSKLDPMLRDLAGGTEGVELHQGVTVTELLRDAGGRPVGVRGRASDGAEVDVCARVVVGADGRGSPLARMAGMPGRVRPHGRFGYMAYYEDLEIESERQRSLLWIRGRDVLYAFPNDDGVTVLAAFLHKDRLAEFRADKEAQFVQAFDGLPRRPRIERARRISPLIGKIDLPNVRRRAAAPGIAFVGDAAQASDPVWGVGVGFALQAAEWLADELAGPLLTDGDVDAALDRYRRRHRSQLAGHHWMMSDFAGGRELNLMERAIHKAAVHDPATARLTHDLGSRSRPVRQVMRPARLARAAVVAAVR